MASWFGLKTLIARLAAGFGSRQLADETTGDDEAVRYLQWLLDAPLFIDDPFVARLFDAVVRPTYEVQSREVGQVSETARRRLFGGTAEAQVKAGLPFLANAVKAGARANAEQENAQRSATSSKTTEVPVETAGRRLEELVAVYADEHPDRLVFIDGDGAARTFRGRHLNLRELAEEAAIPPRLLVFIEARADTKLLPMACELTSGRTKLLFENFIARQWSDAEVRPEYPPDNSANTEKRRQYWATLSSRFDSRVAMEVVEQGTSDPDQPGNAERFTWIDFRMPIGPDGTTMHLHLVCEGRDPIGTFGYNFVRRGYRHGVRILGTMKAGLDVNVLALFDR